MNHWGMREVVGPSVSITGFTVATDVNGQKARMIEADVRLIAAAPELLEMLMLVTGFLEKASVLDFNEDVNCSWAAVVSAKARTLIAKATAP